MWHVIAGEYPPDSGGVSDYTESLVAGLSNVCREIHVWTRGNHTEVTKPYENVFVHRCAGDFNSIGLRRLDCEIANFQGPRRIIVQYVPHAFGYKAMNVPFAFWVRSRATKYDDDVQLMVHEVAYPWVRSPLKHNLIAAVNEFMMRIMVGVASRVYVSTTAWNKRLLQLGVQQDRLRLLAIPSNIPEATDHLAIESIRSNLGSRNGDRVIIGHFGTYAKNVRNVLQPIINQLMATSFSTHLHLIGGGGEAFMAELANSFPGSKVSISATGRLQANEIGNHIRACDVMLQPYGDGANTRRTSLMACLINRRATISTTGHNCEPFWEQQSLVRLASVTEPASAIEYIQALIQAPETRHELGERAYQYYQQHMSLKQTLTVLTDAADA